jgi:hypothetical protein
MNELDFGCRCPGADTQYVECNNAATQEDGLCDNCRERDCPTTPLAYLMRETHELISSGQPYTEGMFERINTEYLRRCKEEGVQP